MKTSAKKILQCGAARVFSVTAAALACAFCFVGCGDDDGKKKPDDADKGEQVTQSEFDSAIANFLNCKNYTETMTVRMDEEDSSPRHDAGVVIRKYDFDNNIVELHTEGIFEGEATNYSVYYIQEIGLKFSVSLDTAYHDTWKVYCYESEMTPSDNFGEVKRAVQIYASNISLMREQADEDFMFDADKGVYKLSIHREFETKKYKQGENGEIITILGTYDGDQVAQLKFKDKRVAEVFYSADSTTRYEDGSGFAENRMYDAIISDVGTTTITVPDEVRAALDAYIASPSGEA